MPDLRTCVRVACATLVPALLAAVLTTTTTAVTVVDTTSPTTTAGIADPVRFRASYPIAAEAPTTAEAGTTFDVVGTAASTRRRGSIARPVALAQRTGGRWSVIDRTTTSSTGAFGFSVEAGEVAATRVLRVEARAYRGLRVARTGPLVVTVVAPADPADPTDPTVPSDPTDPAGPSDPADPGTGFDAPEPLPSGYVGAGSASSWTYLFGGGGRWNPCQVIRWAYNPTAEGYAALPDVQQAFAKIAGVSELRFKYVGASPWRYGSGEAFPADQADIVVGWADEQRLPVLAGNVVGYGGGSGRWTPAGSDVAVQIERGFMVLDNGHMLPGGFTRSGWGQIITHEALHALGLGHASESVQIMYGMAHQDNIRFGAGDLTGMRTIGAAPGCLA